MIGHKKYVEFNLCRCYKERKFVYSILFNQQNICPAVANVMKCIQW